jgi:hypothetical protein
MLATACDPAKCEMSTAPVVDPNTPVVDPTTPTTPTVPDVTVDHCELKAIFKNNAANSGVTGAGGVCYGKQKTYCENTDQCDWIVVTPTAPVATDGRCQ